ncbi:MerR family transcriptional regulator [Eubacterium barkeri]|uniref:MerR family transcriptional regulator n=1 Tax=Eubacterium barkeri TaxID=1528 RepID=UPI000B7F2CB1|nr:MerR family transcriptional regulator [Eubacterium barkeri]
MKINEVAKLTGVTVRTLHYYDEIGLLKPSETTAAGYRLYNSTVLETLQQILFFRELDFSLKDIKEIMTDPNYDKANALTKHRELLLQKRSRIDDLIGLLDNTLKGERDMSFKQFDNTEFEATKKKYATEVKERWGNTAAYAESEEKTSSYDQTQWKMLSGEGEAILQAFGENRNIQPDSNEAQILVKKWQDYITANFYNCTKEILSCLGLMYIGDERFTQKIDQNGKGTAEFMAAAIEVFCSK